MQITHTHIYFVGIGGIGMSALARYFNFAGHFVAGYDATKSKLTQSLEKEHIKIHYQDNINLVPESFTTDKDNTLVIYTPAIPENHSELKFFRQNGFTVLKRAEVLGILSQNKKTIAVAGTHGKTTITSMISHIFNIANKLKAAFVGGIVKNYESNFIFDDSSLNGWLIAEADEFDRSFMQLEPYLSVISAVDADHLDIYGSEAEMKKAFADFAEKTQNILLINENINLKINKNLYIFKYGLDKKSTFYAKNIRIENGTQKFDIIYPDGTCKDIKLNMPGKVNVENAVVAFASAYFLGIDPKLIKCALDCFEGIERRFDIVLKNDNIVFINDYAHHPQEIKRLAEAVKSLYPDKKITAVFQPHLYSRTRDFADEFAKALDNFDEVILTDIYPAREKEIEGVSSKLIFDKISAEKHFCQFNEIVNFLKNEKPEILITVGAGDIDNLVEPLKNTFLN